MYAFHPTIVLYAWPKLDIRDRQLLADLGIRPGIVIIAVMKGGKEKCSPGRSGEKYNTPLHRMLCRIRRHTSPRSIGIDLPPCSADTSDTFFLVAAEPRLARLAQHATAEIIHNLA